MIRRMALACLKRWGFAQNKKDGLNGDMGKTKLPDFMALRALPLFLRASRWLYPIACVADVLLVLAALAACGPVWKDGGGFARRGANDVDDNNTILTFAVCRARMPTPLSWLAVRLFAKLRPWNYGCAELVKEDAETRVAFLPDTYRPVYGALRWYHRAEAGGNPEVAELWKPIVERWFT